MYSKQEIKNIKQEFWTAFGRYMQPVLSHEGEKINWVNYKTHIKPVKFVLEVNFETAFVGIIISNDKGNIGKIYFEHFLQHKKMLEQNLNETWQWEQNHENEFGKFESRIYTEIGNINILRKSDWPAIISFLKPRIITLDAFWSEARYAFEDLT